MVNTHKGLFKYNRLPFGVASANHGIPAAGPAISMRLHWQYSSDWQGWWGASTQFGRGLEMTGRSWDEIEVREVPFPFASSWVPWSCDQHCRVATIGSQGSSNHWSASTDKRDWTQIISQVGELLCKILHNHATVLAPLYQLLWKEVKWQWKSEQETAFEEVKELLKSSQLLVHFNSELPLVLACDASPYRVGAILSHRLVMALKSP